MFFNALFVLVAFIVSVLAENLLSVNNPKTVTECAPLTITWQDGKGPYFLSVVPGDSPCDEALIEFPENKNTWLNWKAANLTAGTAVIFALEDSTGEEVWTSKFTVQKGNSTDCHTADKVAAPTSTDDGRTTLVANPGAAPTTSSSSGSSNGPINAGGAISAAAPQSRIQAGFVLGAVVMGSALLL